ncbi:hypothetical protein HDU92_001260 [Lobulomyces angularis]|nr:hypothetical protein HDU92_001260 [Lobulomyces angularis]
MIYEHPEYKEYKPMFATLCEPLYKAINENDIEKIETELVNYDYDYDYVNIHIKYDALKYAIKNKYYDPVKVFLQHLKIDSYDEFFYSQDVEMIKLLMELTPFSEKSEKLFYNYLLKFLDEKKLNLVDSLLNIPEKKIEKLKYLYPIKMYKIGNLSLIGVNDPMNYLTLNHGNGSPLLVPDIGIAKNVGCVKRYKENAVDIFPSNSQNGIGMKKLFWQVIGRKILDKNINSSICQFLKYRHKYYKNSSILLKSEESRAVDSIKLFIKKHKELDNVPGVSPSDVDVDEYKLSESEIKFEEENLISIDDDDEFLLKNLKSSFSCDLLDEQLVNISGLLNTPINKSKSVEIPQDILDYLDQLGDDEDNFKKNVLAFYKFRHEGKFLNFEQQYVLIEDEKIINFFDSKTAANSYASKNGLSEACLIQPIDDSKSWGGKKRLVNSVKTPSDCGYEYKVDHQLSLNICSRENKISVIGVLDSVGGREIEVDSVKITGWDQAIQKIIIDANPPKEKEILIGFDVLKSYWMVSVPDSKPTLIIGTTKKEVFDKISELNIRN